MKIVNYRREGDWTAGVVRGDRVIDVAGALAEDGGIACGTISVRELLERFGADLAFVEKIVAAADAVDQHVAGAYADVELGAPVSDPKKVLCVGLNYADHVAETGRKLPEFPDVFTKFATSLIGPRDAIGGADLDQDLDFEAEIAIVIGKTAKGVCAADALDHVAGAMLLNDVTLRALQYRGTQWTMGKAVDGTTPSGPALITLDEVGDLQSLDITCRVNGELMQSSNTRHMIFPIATIVEYISRTITLEPGDIIATGTPDGIGIKRTPPVILRSGDRVTIAATGLGEIDSLVA